MRHIITLSLLLLTTLTWGQDPIKIEERRESFSVGMQNALVSNIPMGKEDLVNKVVKDEIKKFKGKVSGKEEFVIEQAIKSSISDKPIDVYVKIIKIAGGKMELAWAINLGGSYLNKSEHPELYRKAEQRVYDVVKRISKEAVDLEVKEEEKKLKDLEKEQNKLEKDKDKLEKDIEKNKSDITSFENEIKVNEASQEGKKAEIKAFHDQENSDPDILKAKNKELEKLVKDKEKLHKKILTAESNIKKAKDSIELNLKSQEAKKGEIEAQRKYIEDEVKTKYGKIK